VTVRSEKFEPFARGGKRCVRSWLPIGQALWLRELQTYVDFPPMQNPASYNLEQVMQQVREMKSVSHAGE